MLCLGRTEGRWIRIQHRSGDVMMVHVYQIEGFPTRHVRLAFEDPARNFEIVRAELMVPPAPSGGS